MDCSIMESWLLPGRETASGKRLAWARSDGGDGMLRLGLAAATIGALVAALELRTPLGMLALGLRAWAGFGG